MGFFDLFTRRKGEEQHEGEEKMTVNGITFWAPKPITNEEYQRVRHAEMDWLEEHYDLNTATGIRSIPEKSGLPRYPSNGCTGDLDYYLRKKSQEYEDAGNLELAILCLQKSNAIRMVAHRGYRKSDYYTLVRLLARSGFIKEAQIEKAKIDAYFGEEDNDGVQSEMLVQQFLDGAKVLGTDLVIMSVHGLACTECAKYEGRVFSLSGKDKRFPMIPSAVLRYGGIHKGCGHTFTPFIYKVNDPDLKYTLSIHKVVDKRYTKDIIAFSNRPFIDDRPQADIEAAKQYQEKKRADEAHKKFLQDHIIEREAQKGLDQRDYSWIQQNLPDLCPKSLSGYIRMKKQNTKNFIKLTQASRELGRDITTVIDPDFHI